MTLSQFLKTRPVFYKTTLAALKKSYYAEGGERLSRTEFICQLGQCGYKLIDSRLGYMVESERPLLPSSTTVGWQGSPGSHLR